MRPLEPLALLPLVSGGGYHSQGFRGLGQRACPGLAGFQIPGLCNNAYPPWHEVSSPPPHPAGLSMQNPKPLKPQASHCENPKTLKP